MSSLAPEGYVPLPAAGAVPCPNCGDGLQVELAAGAQLLAPRWMGPGGAEELGPERLVRPEDLKLLCAVCTGVYRVVEDGLEFVCLHGGL